LSVTWDRSVVFSTNKTDRHDVAESGVKYHNPNPSYRKMYGLIFSNCDVHLVYEYPA
jgi:hypothetical protein